MESLCVELIANIFLMGCEDIRDPYFYRRLLRYRTSISSVSSHWRDVALATCLLWTDIVPTPFYDSDIDRTLHFLRLNLERSGGASIDVRFGRPEWSTVSDVSLASLWIPISEQLHRCRTIEIYGLSEEIMKTIVPLPGHLGRLEKLSISNPLPHPSPLILASSAAAPKLREICLDQVDFRGLSSVPTEHLTAVTFYAQSGPWSLFSAFMSRCSALIELTVFFEVTAEEARTTPVILPSLHELTVCDVRFPRYLSTPALKHLCCADQAFEFDGSSMPNLSSFGLYNPPKALSWKNWSPPVSLAAIHTLELKHCLRSDHVFELLLRGFDGDTSSIVFPSLRTLWLGPGVGFSPNILRVLDRRPKLTLRCNQFFFGGSKIAPKDLADRYGERIDYF